MEVFRIKKKALILLPSLLHGDGIATVMMSYFDDLVDNDWIVHFLVLKDSKNDFWYEHVIQRNGKVFVLPNLNKYSFVNKKFISDLLKDKYDVVHVNIPGQIGYLTLSEAKKRNIHCRIFHCHNPKNNTSLKAKISTNLYDSLMIPLATELVACSKSTGSDRFGDKNFLILRNLIDPNKFAYSENGRKKIRQSMGLTDETIVGVVGRMTSQKNPLFVMDCFFEIKKRIPNAKLIWVGDGEMKNAIHRKISEINLEDSVFLVGRHDDLQNWYSTFDIFILPSLFEGLGIVFLEAQANGLLCFGSDCVPSDTEIVTMHRIPLEYTAKQWADIIISEYIKKSIRHSQKEVIEISGYSKEKNSDTLRKIYDSLYE